MNNEQYPKVEEHLSNDENSAIENVKNDKMDDGSSITTLHFCFLVHGWKGMACVSRRRVLSMQSFFFLT